MRCRWRSTSCKGKDGRRVILVFTDGDDTSSKARLGTVMDRARADEVMVYAIGLESNYFNGQQTVRSRPDGGLKKIADETGGGYFELKKTADLAPTFTRVAQELHSQYVLGFAANAARRQGAQTDGPDEAARDDGAGAPQLSRGSRQVVRVRSRRRRSTGAGGGQTSSVATISTASSTPTTYSAVDENVQSRMTLTSSSPR